MGHTVLIVTWQILALSSIFPELNISNILVQSQPELTQLRKNSSTLCEEVLKVLTLVLDLLNSTLTRSFCGAKSKEFLCMSVII